VYFSRRAVLVLLILCMGCSAQLSDQDLTRRIERQVRAYYNVPAGVKIDIGTRQGSEFPNYDKVSLTFVNGEQKQTHEFLLSKDGKTLVRFTKMDLSSDPYAAVMKKIDINGRPVRGNKDAKVTIVNYDDFECPFCSRMHQTLFPEVFKAYADRVRVIYKDYPLVEIHPWATRAAVNANCLAAQNNEAYWDFADYVHANQKEVNGGEKTSREQQFATLDRIALEQGKKHNLDSAQLQTCVKAQKEDAVRTSMREADKLGVNATPTLFVNGEKLDGAVSASELRAVLDRALHDAGLQQASQPASQESQPKAASAAGPSSK
jgi:protein-disulfide isomerase